MRIRRQWTSGTWWNAFLLAASTLAFFACSRDEPSQEGIHADADSTRGELGVLQRRPAGVARGRLQKFRGVVYLSRADSSAAQLAIEREDGSVFLVVGGRAGELASLHHRKVEVTGFVQGDTTRPGSRGAVEVLEFRVLVDDSYRLGRR